MAIEMRQQMKLSQQLVMTPQLQQAIKLLQLPVLSYKMLSARNLRRIRFWMRSQKLKKQKRLSSLN
nr:hypothetical protein [Geotalea toluenoxydans]